VNAIRVFRHGLLVGRQEFAVFWSWKTWLAGWMLRIVTSAAAWVLLGEALGSEEKLRFLLIGNAVIVGAQSAAWTVAASTWDRWDGTYPLLVVAPSGLLPAIMGRTSVWLLNGVATSLLTFGILAAIFRMPLPMPGTLFVPLIVVLICASTYGFALFLGSLVTRAPRWRNVVHNVATIVMTACCGVSVPVTFWPGWIQLVTKVLPVTHGLQSVRLILGNEPGQGVLAGVGFEAAVGLGWLGMSVLILDRMANSGRADGSIELV
jgi:ABC-2 type transport system permease protein